MNVSACFGPQLCRDKSRREAINGEPENRIILRKLVHKAFFLFSGGLVFVNHDLLMWEVWELFVALASDVKFFNLLNLTLTMQIER